MAPQQNKNKNSKFYKRYLKTLQSAKGSTKLIRELIRQAPIPVLKLLSNAAIIASRGTIKLTPSQKRQFAKKRQLFNILGNRTINFEKKRQYLVQSGGAIPAFIPILLSAVVPLVGELLFKAFSKK